MVGRPSSYRDEFAQQAAKLCRLGATDIELADFFEVDVRTIYRWKIDHDEFCQALKSGKESSDDRVERSLYAKATGYTFDAVKIFQYEGTPVEVPYREHVPPDTTAAIFWLKNRRPADWRDRVDLNHTGKLDVSNMSEADVDARIAELVGKAGASGAYRSSGSDEG